MTGLAKQRCPQCWAEKFWPVQFIGARGRPVTWCRTCQRRYRNWSSKTPAQRAATPRRGVPFTSELRANLVVDSKNRKLGGIPSSMTSRGTCPRSCAFFEAGCYAEYHVSAHHWRRLGAGELGTTWAAFCQRVAALPPGQLWRHNVAGDLPGPGEVIDAQALEQLVDANRGRRGFTFTHCPVMPPEPPPSAARRGLAIVLGSPELQRLFWAKVDRNGPVVLPELGPCAVWTASTFAKRGGYGAFGVKRDGEQFTLKAHHVGFVLKHGRLPRAEVVRHACDNPRCVEHVLEGSHADNIADKVGRGRVPRGAAHHASKLSTEQVIEIVHRRAAGERGRDLAREYGVSESHVSSIHSGHRRGKSRGTSSVYQANREAIARANANGFTVNLSANSLVEADCLAELGVAPVAVVLPENAPARATRTPMGRKVVVCPAQTSDLTCASCRLCALPHRKAIIGFRAHGQASARVSELVQLRRTA